MDCLTNVIGLSQTACDCWDADKPVDFNTSESGLFITDLVSLQFTNSAADCEQGGVWDILTQARTAAINAFLVDLPIVFSNYYDERFVAFNGWMASTKFNSSMSVLSSNDLAGIKLTPHQIKGGAITLVGVELALENITPGQVVEVLVYSNRDLTTALGSVNITLTTSGAFYGADFASPIVLNLGDQDANGYTYNDPNLEFYIVYQTPAGARYVNNLIFEGGGCNSCGKKQPPSRQYPFLQYTAVEGIEAANAASLYPAPRKTDTQAHGLRIKAQYGCDITSWVCEGLSYDPTQVGAGTYKAYARVVADALNQKAAELACSKILESSNINSITIWSGEKLMGMRNHFKKNYMESVFWLASHFPTDLSDCLSCKTTFQKTTLKL